jgi:NAD+ synthetase
MRIILAQLNPTVGDLQNNAAQILKAAEGAINQQAQLLLTPELSLCGYPPRDLLLNPSFITAMAQQLQILAQQLPPQLTVLAGFAEANPQANQAGEKPLFNSVACLHNGQVQQIFRKRLLPTYDVFDEDRYFEPTQTSNTFSLSWPDATAPPLKVGVTICEDLWNDELFWGKRSYQADPLADLMAQQVDLIVNLSASPYTVAKQPLREKMLGHAAQRYGIPLIYTNQVGGNDDLIFDGHSVAFDRVGTVICRAPGFTTDLAQVQFNPQSQDLQATTPAAIAPLPPCPEAEIWSALVLGVQDYGRKCGFAKMVLGLSGGIDSALVATIAAAAVGPANVLAILMPSPYSSHHSITDAEALVTNLGITGHTLPIQAMMQSFEHTLADLFTGREPDVTEENLQSRIRGTLLMAIANKFGHLLLSTGNKSEMAVGYCTLYGDMDGGLAAIADVPKTQVYKLCDWINQEGNTLVRQQLALATTNTAPLIPPHIIAKPPSAELKPDQVDQDSLPTYDVLDAILDRLVHQHQSPDQIVAAGFEVATVERIAKLVKRSEFKRRQAAPGLKITDRAFGTGWRMPIASRW